MKEFKELIEVAKEISCPIDTACDFKKCQNCEYTDLKHAVVAAESALKRTISIDVLKLNPDHFSALPLDMAHIRPINALSGQSVTIIVIPREE